MQALYDMPALNTKHIPLNTTSIFAYCTQVKSSTTSLRLHYTDKIHNGVYAKQRGHHYPEGTLKCLT